MLDKINIVIPMAGAGSRFAIEGYSVPKPFIEFNGKMMIEHVLNSFEGIDANFILILQEKFWTEQREQLEILKNNYSIDFVTVPKLTMGAAITALAAHKKINAEYDIIFADSDNIFQPSDVINFIEYVRGKSDGNLIETKEKEVISNHAISGMYYFKELNQFRDAVIDLVVESDTSKGEFYMSNVYNHLKKEMRAIGVYDIEQFDCVGTPEQLRTYLDKGNYARL